MVAVTEACQMVGDGKSFEVLFLKLQRRVGDGSNAERDSTGSREDRR